MCYKCSSYLQLIVRARQKHFEGRNYATWFLMALSTSVKLGADASVKVFVDPALFPLRHICIERAANLREIIDLNVYSNESGADSALFFFSHRFSRLRLLCALNTPFVGICLV